MKCFEINGKDIIAGLPIVWNDGRPHVLIGQYRAVLTNDLLEKDLGMRLLRAQALYLNGHIVFIPEGENSFTDVMDNNVRNDAVIVSFVSDERDSSSFADVSGPFGPTGGAVIRQNSLLIKRRFGASTSVGFAGLARLGRGNELVIHRTFDVAAALTSGWRSKFRRRSREAHREIRLVKLTEQGRLDFCQTLGQGCQALSPA